MEIRGEQLRITANDNCNAGNEHIKSTGSSVVDEEEEEGLTLSAVDEGKEEDLTLKFPPGYRFCPTDDELIDYYLSKKVNNTPLPPNNFHDVNLYNQAPDELVAKYKCCGENSWYFFTPRDRKYPNGMRPKRSAGEGFWKATGADRLVTREDGTDVGFRKSLVFYKGKPPNGTKTDWIMHEYRVKDTPETQPREHGSMRLDNWVLCKIHRKAKSQKPPKAVSKDEVSVPDQKLALDVDDGGIYSNEKEVLGVALDSNMEHNFNYSNHNNQEGDLDSNWSFEHSFNPMGSLMFQQPNSFNFPGPDVSMSYPLQWKPCNYDPIQPHNHFTPTEPIITNATANSFQSGPTLESQNFTPHDHFTPTEPIITNATANSFQSGPTLESQNFTPHDHFSPTEPIITNAKPNNFQTGPTLESQNFTPHNHFTPTEPIITNATGNNFQAGPMLESPNFTPHNHFTPTEPIFSNAIANNHQEGVLESQTFAPKESIFGMPSNNYQLKTLSNQWQRHQEDEYFLSMQANHDMACSHNNSLPWNVLNSDEMILKANPMKKIKCHPMYKMTLEAASRKKMRNHLQK